MDKFSIHFILSEFRQILRERNSLWLCICNIVRVDRVQAKLIVFYFFFFLIFSDSRHWKMPLFICIDSVCISRVDREVKNDYKWES